MVDLPFLNPQHRCRQFFARVALFLAPVLALTTAVAVQAGQHAEDWVSYAQPDQGLIRLPPHWVVSQLAGEAIRDDEGGLNQDLISARGYYGDAPVVLRSWRFTQASAASIALGSVLDNLRAGGIEFRSSRFSEFTKPPSMESRGSLLSYSIGGQSFETIIIECANASVHHLLMLTVPAASTLGFSNDRPLFFSHWKPSIAFTSVDAIPRPQPVTREVSLKSGERATVSQGWQVVASDLPPVRLGTATDSPTATKLLSLRRIHEGSSPTEILLLSRIDAPMLSIEQVAGMLTADAQAVATSFGKNTRIASTTIDADTHEFTSGLLPNDLFAAGRIERRGSDFYSAVCYATTVAEAIGSTRALLSSLERPAATSPAAPIRTEAFAAADLPLASSGAQTSNHQPPPRFMFQQRPPQRGLDLVRFAENLGGAIGIAPFFAFPALLFGVWNRRRALVVLLGSALLLGWAISSTAAELAMQRLHEHDLALNHGVTEPPSPFPAASLVHSAEKWAFVLDTLGETALPSSDDSLSTLACRLVHGEPNTVSSAAGALLVGGLATIGGPLLLRYQVLGRPLKRKRWAYLAGLCWLLAGMMLLTWLGTSSNPHRALVLGSTFLVLLLLPERRKNTPSPSHASTSGSQPHQQ
jgi:hypothetical protein